MVIIDTVYQRVLAIANKEQRGYITPQEFNLFANQAQMDIFEQYFYDLNQFGRAPNVGIEHSNISDKIDEKLSLFKVIDDSLTGVASTSGYSSIDYALPIDLYKIGNIQESDSNIEISKTNYKELANVLNSSLVVPSITKPIYVSNGDTISVFPGTIEDITLHYVRVPSQVAWGYTVVNEKPMLNPGNTIDFDLHVSEENNLVFKILQLAGVMLDPNLYQIAAQEEAKDIQQEKA